VKTQRPESRKSRQRTGPAIVYGAVPAVLLASFLASGVAHSFQGNWSALFCFGDAWVTSLALLLALRAVAESPDRVGYALLASLPLGALGALGWCRDNWSDWPLR
jgi:hypothetical protein